MPIADALLAEYDHEMTTTRKLLERVPENRFDWKPHPKSMSLAELATHLATLPYWGEMTLAQSHFDLEGAPPNQKVTTRAELLERFDTHTAAARAQLAGKADGELMAPWSLKHGKQTFFTMPKVTVWRTFVMNHIIHHRAQLSVYLRMHDVPIPAMYGPSADEAS